MPVATVSVSAAMVSMSVAMVSMSVAMVSMSVAMVSAITGSCYYMGTVRPTQIKARQYNKPEHLFFYGK